ncbi:MAG TPA: matrixin family metalloprotease [Bryobacteraceae bacterium]|nr:matrixin family metalloprotease [Bryobacteraceae bacterium]
MKALVLFSLLATALPGAAAVRAPNWTGKYAPCDHHSDLLQHGPLNLAVRISTSNDILAQQFEKALDFWSEVLDLQWHEVDSDACSMQLVDGTPRLFDWCECMSARSQLPDRPAFEGWIAFNPRFKLSKEQMFLDSVHEIGHVLGLAHNPDGSSIMFAFGGPGAASLDSADLDALAVRHTLRPGILASHRKRSVPVKAPVRVAAHARRRFQGLF